MVINTGASPSQLQENRMKIAEFHKKHIDKKNNQEKAMRELGSNMEAIGETGSTNAKRGATTVSNAVISIII